MNVSTWMVAFVAVYNFGGVVFDAALPATARQHLWNPAWPPHAKFHNAQTMTLGVLNGALSLALLFGPVPLTTPVFLAATALASHYFVALLLAASFPGTAWVDPEFADETPLPLGLHPQKLVSLALVGLALAAVGLRFAGL